MPATNNEKYIAEIWLENGEEEDFKKSFLESLMLQWQGHRDDSSGFNADMVDRKHYSDILNDINEATKDLIPEFKIGGVNVNRENIDARGGELKLGFDAIQLYITKPNCEDYEDGYYPDFALLPWDEGYDEITRDWDSFNGCQGPNLLQAFEELYEKVLERVTYDEFNEVKETIEDLDNLGKALRPNVKIVYDEDGEIIGSEINAASINGLYIYIMTKNEYNALEDSIKNDVHNLFILKDNETVFDDFLKAKQPNTATINKYYHFRVITEIINKTTGEVFYVEIEDGVTKIVNRTTKEVTVLENGMTVDSFINGLSGEIAIEKWLQYKHEDLEEWRDMCKVTDFLDFGTIEKALIQVLEESTVYKINKDALLNSLKEIDINFDAADFPFLNYFRNNFITGAQSENFKLNSSDSKYLPTTIVGKFKYLNLDNFGTSILNQSKSYVDNKFDTICNLSCINTIRNKTEDALMRSISNERDIRKMIGNPLETNSFPAVYGRISSLQAELDEMMGEWKAYWMPSLTGKNGTQTVNYYNEALGLAHVNINFSCYYKAIPKDTWRTPCASPDGVPFPYTVLKAKPASNMAILNPTHINNTYTRIDNMGRIMVSTSSDITNSSTLYHTGSVMYRFNKLYTDEELSSINQKMNNRTFTYNKTKYRYIDYNGYDKDGLLGYDLTSFQNRYNG